VALREKKWYGGQHDEAVRARDEGTLLERTPLSQVDSAGESPLMFFEFWRKGEDYLALLVADPASTAPSSGAVRDGDLVAASTLFRRGPITDAMRGLLSRALPGDATAPATTGSAHIALAGMVHVYVAPPYRGAGRGEMLARVAMRRLRGEGFTHVLALADDCGSGRLRAWYAGLGFVAAREFEETAMVAVAGDSRDGA